MKFRLMCLRGWAWTSLSQIADLYTGNSINENEKANKYSNIKEGLFYIATKDIDFEGKINYDNGIRIPLSESKFKIAPVNSTLLCIEGGSAGRKIGFINQDVCFVNKLCCFHSNSLNNLYLFYYLQSRAFIDLFNANKSGLIGGVSLNLLKSIFIPVAPIIEQNFISKIITTYLEKISSLDNDKETLELTIKKAKSNAIRMLLTSTRGLIIVIIKDLKMDKRKIFLTKYLMNYLNLGHGVGLKIYVQ